MLGLPTDILLFLVSCALALVLIVGNVYLSYSITRRVLPEADGITRWCAQCVVGLALATLGFHVLALLGLFRPFPATASVLIAVTACRWRGPSFKELGSVVRADLSAGKNYIFAVTTRFQKILLSVYALMVLGLGERVLLLPPVGWDSLTYRAFRPALWVQQGDVWFDKGFWAGWGNTGYPAGGEVLWAWSMLPFHSDLLLGAGDFVVWCFLFPSLYGLCSELSFGRSRSLAITIYCAFVPVGFFMVGSGYVDNYLSLCMVLAALFGIRYIRSAQPIDLVLLFLCLGLASGIKYRAYPSIVLGAVVAVSFVFRRKGFSPGAWAVIAAAVASMFVFILPWWGYNIAVKGDPIYPYGAGLSHRWHSFMTSDVVFRDSPSEDHSERKSPPPNDSASGADRVPARPANEIAAVGKMFTNNPGMPPTFGFLSGVVLLLFPFGLFSLWRVEGRTALFLCSLILGFLILYFSPIHADVRLQYSHTNARYLLTSFFLMTVIGLHAVRNVPEAPFATILMCIPLVQLSARIAVDWRPYEAPHAFTLTFTIVCVFLVLRYMHSRGYRRSLVVAGVVGLIFFLGVAQWNREIVRYRAYRNSFFFHNFPRYWVSAAEQVDVSSDNRKIAITRGAGAESLTAFAYPFLGRRLQNSVHRFPPSPREPDRFFSEGEAATDTADYDRWRERLSRAEISHVMSFRPSSLELSWMRLHPESFEPVHAGDGFGLYRLRDRPARPPR